ncbi:cytochrome c biogenesis protein ResB [Aquabacterium fontiphilum]|uniref:cytochrome c biogenesis protein ResB n=1 Tax=Aquabacterium fontiphilum TaxID=450365 RepID=UPI0013765112|nr:cytochrome c biogenesis protein ResB [Aquabacterium fontiphilum]NBD21100.1 cytochrome c biogenesis protein ResB [Aquabacterium fontiphilum]
MTQAAVSAVPSPRRPWRDALELLASMRFAIALLTVICIASAIGTVILQGEPLVNYVEQFGPFWAEVFGTLGLYRIYSAPWFLVILAFLVLSTSLCIARNTPKILADWRTHKEQVREQALLAFHHHAEGRLPGDLNAARDRVAGLLAEQGWSVRTEQRQASPRGGAGIMFGARRGAANKLGYIAAHGAIVLICLGGLFDGDLLIKLQAWSRDLQVFQGPGDNVERSRLSVDNPSYRANLFVPEGQRTNAAVVQMADGMLLQPLPFDVELKKFIVEYYDTGMPKRFASEIVIHDPAEPAPTPYTVEVNHPVIYKGITLFQSSFEDGGSKVQLKPIRLDGRAIDAVPVDTQVGATGVRLPAAWWGDGDGMSLEVTDLRLINVEDLAQAQRVLPDTQGAPVTGAMQGFTRHLGSGAKAPGEKRLVNIGPAVTYKLRDSAGQAREFHNYMAPVTLDGHAVFLVGVRDTPAESFRYLRVPADEDMSMAGWLRLRAALADPGLRQTAAERLAERTNPQSSERVRADLTASARRTLELFAGTLSPTPRDGGAPAVDAGQPQGGLMALSSFIENVVAAEQREEMAGSLIRLLNGTLFELYNLSRERAGLPAVGLEDETTRAFLAQAVLSLSDAVFYPEPVLLTLDGFEHRQASVFQVTRTPGRNVVYLGCLLLIIGVFAMLYIRERRLWVWLHADEQGQTAYRMALSSTRQTLDTDQEFAALRAALAPDAAPPTPAPGAA